MENRVIKTVPIPALTVNNPADRLVELYRKLGWNKDKMLVDPTKIKVTKSDFEHLIKGEQEHAKIAFPEISGQDIVISINMLWLNSGPSDNGATPGMVELCEGWLSE